MLKIQSLLNPSIPDDDGRLQNVFDTDSWTTPLTPPLTSTASSSSFSPRIGTPDISSPAKRQKLVKDAPVFIKGTAKGQVHYAPFESDENAIVLPQHLENELIQQHRRFKIYPSGNDKDGLIVDFVKHIPYSSEKNDFFTKTGCDGFDVFQYTFIVPNDPIKKTHLVMWDYNTGLVRITPFFKACKYSKTIPAKALNANPGLKEMAHSVTGGALAAQGYWMPYSCARAICLTFAYPIRWALTPIFGPSFVRECLPPHHPSFGRFKIDAETTRCAKMAMDGLRSVAERDIPRSVPEEPAVQAKPTFRSASPLASGSEGSTASGSYRLPMSSALDSPAISPKTTKFNTTGWTSINPQAGDIRNAPPSPPPNTPSHALGGAPLTWPSSASWRPADPVTDGASPATSSTKRLRRRSLDDDYSDSASDSASSESEDMEIVDTLSKPAVVHAKPEFRGERTPYTAAPSSTKKSKRYTAADYRAAGLLLALSRDHGKVGAERVGGKGKGRLV